MSAVDTLPCVCGNESVITDMNVSPDAPAKERTMYRIRCPRCGRASSGAFTWEEAARRWNKMVKVGK